MQGCAGKGGVVWVQATFSGVVRGEKQGCAGKGGDVRVQAAFSGVVWEKQGCAGKGGFLWGFAHKGRFMLGCAW